MKISLQKLILVVIIPFTVLYGISCKGKSSANRANSGDALGLRPKAPVAKLIKIDKPSDNQRFSSGNKIGVSVSLLGEDKPDSLQIYFDGKLESTLLNGPWQFDIESGSCRLGRIPIKVIAYSGNKRPHTLTRFILLFSDIIPVRSSYRVINVYPHDPEAYTQGLLVHNGYFYESTGQIGRSTLRKVNIETGEVLMQHKLENKFFGEGLVCLKDKFYQLTWTHNTGFVYDVETFTEIRQIHYDTQGWGLTTDGERLLMSDGTNRIYFLEPEYFTVLSSLEVYDNEKAVYQLNELEYINGDLWANIYMTDLIARIDPSSGKVLSYYDLSGIISEYDKNLDSEDVLNGIAWDSDNEKLYVTGKRWSKLFEIIIK